VSMLAPLSHAVGKHHSILLTAVFFGLAHFFSVPYGIIGVLMSFLLSYFLSKAMMEVKGIFCSWVIHILQDVAIFKFMAIRSVAPGG